MVLKTVCDLVKIRDLSKAFGKRLQTFHFSLTTEKILLGFEDGLYCQLEVDNGYDDGDTFIEQSYTFYWQEYNAEALVQNGVLTAEWVAQQKEATEMRIKAEQEKRERDMLALLKQKYEQKESPDGV